MSQKFYYWQCLSRYELCHQIRFYTYIINCIHRPSGTPWFGHTFSVFKCLVKVPMFHPPFLAWYTVKGSSWQWMHINFIWDDSVSNTGFATKKYLLVLNHSEKAVNLSMFIEMRNTYSIKVALNFMENRNVKSVLLYLEHWKRLTSFRSSKTGETADAQVAVIFGKKIVPQKSPQWLN
jgi:hypothetical protein